MRKALIGLSLLAGFNQAAMANDNADFINPLVNDGVCQSSHVLMGDTNHKDADIQRQIYSQDTFKLATTCDARHILIELEPHRYQDSIDDLAEGIISPQDFTDKFGNKADPYSVFQTKLIVDFIVEAHNHDITIIAADVNQEDVTEYMFMSQMAYESFERRFYLNTPETVHDILGKFFEKQALSPSEKAQLQEALDDFQTNKPEEFARTMQLLETSQEFSKAFVEKRTDDTKLFEFIQTYETEAAPLFLIHGSGHFKSEAGIFGLLKAEGATPFRIDITSSATPSPPTTDYRANFTYNVTSDILNAPANKVLSPLLPQ